MKSINPDKGCLVSEFLIIIIISSSQLIFSQIEQVFVLEVNSIPADNELYTGKGVLANKRFYTMDLT